MKNLELKKTVNEIKESGDGWNSVLGIAEEEISKLEENTKNHVWRVKRRVNREEHVKHVQNTVRCNIIQPISRGESKWGGRDVWWDNDWEFSQTGKGHQITYQGAICYKMSNM